MKLSCVVVTLAASLLAGRFSDVWAQDAPDKQPAEAGKSVEKPQPVMTREQAETEFSHAMTNCHLAGFFTIEGKAAVANQKPDRYQIAGVQKVQGDHWTFTYVHRGIPIPLVLRVLWAGNTPVMTLDEFTIAGMGTFSARVMFDLKANLYAGTWQHGDVGGLMYGRIDRSDQPAKKTSSVRDRLQRKIAVKFNRSPLQNAVTEIAKQCDCDVVIDGDALKFSGYTKNMPQTFELEDTGVAAIGKIVSRYEGMCLVIQDGTKPFVITTVKAAKDRGLKVFEFKPAG